AGTVAMTVVMLSWNYIILPMYMPFVTREFVWNYLFTFFLPFNLFGGIVNTSLTLLLYKPITSGLRMTRMLPPVPKSGKKAKVFSPGVIAASLFVLITCVLWAMAQQGVFDRTPDVDYNYMSAPYESNYED
ncbi:MAG: hypothetical protein FWC67_01945, partial [Defluviitaleaceae bacterium]|nr:hypothetical protein [Defluviitaleaceae bacterium]